MSDVSFTTLSGCWPQCVGIPELVSFSLIRSWQTLERAGHLMMDATTLRLFTPILFACISFAGCRDSSVSGDDDRPTHECSIDDDCSMGEVCDTATGACVAVSCTDGISNGEESDVDCGGADCEPCADHLKCGSEKDCESGACVDGQCQAPSCMDGAPNGAETGSDCGGPDCEPCDVGEGCEVASDCASGVCADNRCEAGVCGDGILHDEESCDDAGESMTCNADCSVAECGDAVGNTTAGEACDDGAANSDTDPDACRTSCQAAGCGDGVVDSGEDCDNADANSDTDPDACRTTCQNAGCGDGVVDDGEACDHGPQNSDTAPDACRTTCDVASCGDGVMDATEQCDNGDANANEPDTCRVSCVTPRCGDGIMDTAEQCDSGSLSVGTALEGESCATSSDCDPSTPICSSADVCQDGSAGDGCRVDADCGAGAPICHAGVCQTTRCPGTPGTEVEDGIDNDCDGTVDNGFTSECVREDVPVRDHKSSCRAAMCELRPDELYVPCGAVYRLRGNHTWAGPANIQGWIKLVRSPDALVLTANTITIHGVLDGRASGHARHFGPGHSEEGNGASHGGLGGRSQYGDDPGDVRGNTYGTLNGMDIQAGSGGGGWGLREAGAGGGAVHLDASTVNVSGQILMNGGTIKTTHAFGAGGGSGGGILIHGQQSVNVSGHLSARGGRGENTRVYGGGGGGGGRIKLFSQPGGVTFTGTRNVSGGARGTGIHRGRPGAEGTFYQSP